MRFLLLALLAALCAAQTGGSGSGTGNRGTGANGCAHVGGDCDMFFTRKCCSGNRHEGKVCMWDAQELVCVESRPGDPEHICAQWDRPEDCAFYHQCGWDIKEFKCEQLSDMDINPVYPTHIGGNTGGNTGSTGGGAPGGYPRPPPGSDCDMYFNREHCTGQVHEGKICLWDVEDHECVESAPGDPEHICGQFAVQSECNQHHMCHWFPAQVKCVQLSDYDPDVFPVHPPYHGGGTGGQGGGPITPPPSDCEDYHTPTSCKGKFHDGKTCMWSATKNDCIESARGDMEHVCDQNGSSESCNQEQGCGWYAAENKCVQASDMPFVPPTGGTGGTSILGGDCETYLTPNLCKGKAHDGKSCMWSATKNECIEAAYGDKEHICDQFGAPNECGDTAGCGWDFAEHKCVQLSDFEYLPPGQLSTAHCHSYRNLRECQTDSACSWNYYSLGCGAPALDSTHDSQAAPKPLSISRCIFVFSLSALSTIFILSAYFYCNRKRPSSDELEDVYTRVDLDTLA